MQRLGQLGFEKVAMVETAEAGSSNVSGPMSNGAPSAVTNSGQSIRDLTNGQPTRIEMARHNAGDLSLDQGNLDSIRGPVVNGGPMPTVEGPDNTYAALASEAANAVTKESAARVLRKLSNGRKFSNNRAAYAAAKRLNIHDSSTALFILTKSASVRGKSMTDFLEGMDLRNHNRANYFREMAVSQTSNLLRKYAEAGIIGPMGVGMDGAIQQVETEITRAKDAVEALVRSDQTLPTSNVVMQVAEVSAPAANAALTEVAEFIAAVGGQVVSPEQAAAMAAMNSGGGMAAGPMPSSPMVGGMPPGAPMPAGAPMAPPAPIPEAAAQPAADPNAAPPMDPNAAPPAEGGMEVTAHVRNLARELDELLLKMSADEADLDIVTSVMDTGAKQPSDLVYQAGKGYDGSAESKPTSSLTSGASNELATQVSSPGGQAATGQNQLADHRFANANDLIARPGSPVDPSTVMGSGGVGATSVNTIQRTRTTDVPTPEYGVQRSNGHTAPISGNDIGDTISKIAEILDAY
jgi:hypothetical protein